MPFQTVFKRYELKYLLTEAQKTLLLQTIAPYMEPDKYGRTTIRNLYFDTPSYLLIRRSIDKPAYKEKLRLRSYSQADTDSPVFVELKKKFDHVVYKRRIPLPQQEAMAWVTGQCRCPETTQIAKEINYFLEYYGSLRPVVFLSYQREAYYAKDDPSLRITFDDTILCRQDDLSLCSPVSGKPILPEDMVLMEVKCAGGIPLWLTRILSRERIYKTSFSKYGTAYETMIFPQLQNNDPMMKEAAANAGKHF